MPQPCSTVWAIDIAGTGELSAVRMSEDEKTFEGVHHGDHVYLLSSAQLLLMEEILH